VNSYVGHEHLTVISGGGQSNRGTAGAAFIARRRNRCFTPMPVAPVRIRAHSGAYRCTVAGHRDFFRPVVFAAGANVASSRAIETVLRD
jgi:hypothetical protein